MRASFLTAIAILVLIGAFPARAQTHDIGTAEFAARRAELMRRFPDGVILLHAESGEKPESEPSFIQNSSFYYFTGLAGVAGAVLVLDAPANESVLFVPPVPFAFGYQVNGVVPETNEASAQALGMTRVVPWNDLRAFLQRRAATVQKFYVDDARRPEALGMPDGMAEVSGSRTLFKQSIGAVVGPDRMTSAAQAIREMRFVKSASEIAILRDNAHKTVQAMRASVPSIRPGVRQRQVEMKVASSCVEAGAVGPSFWPWTMSGPNAHVPMLVKSVYSYDQLDRVMQAGDVVRVDIGCTAHHYGADVGRTFPAAKTFSAGQRETWNLLIAAYKAGMASMRPGVTIADVLATSRAEIERQRANLRTSLGRQAADVLLGTDGMAQWSIHAVGVDSGETPLQTLVAGAVLAFEPIFSVGADAFYLEDMILITPTGHEVLSAGLPYTAAEIEAAKQP
ncbi:MAG: aminopeptidase P N-terminal domain-containing protein [Gemmatimonadaceae bacterium]